MNREELKSEIKKEFGTIQRFGRVAGIDREKLLFAISKKANQDKIDALEKVFKSFKGKGNEEMITTVDRLRVETQIFKHFRKRQIFRRKFPLFTDKFLSDFLNGKKKYRSARVEKLFQVLNDLDENQSENFI
ncbi:MAG: hypothetical protein KAJ19_15455 [Gammaproteobacteria bacterium]|nr:hypothetical protein [Gammaproteobacteria bacterium]